jgi:hypothetical protein
VPKLFTFCDTNDEIADLLEAAEFTIETHVKNLFRKLRVKSRRPLAVGWALPLGLCLPFRSPPRTSRWPRRRPYLLPYGGGISLFWKSSALKVQRPGL